jgi:hypothetical protein
MTDTSILILGMQDWGLILYDIIEHKIIRFLQFNQITTYFEGEKIFHVNALVRSGVGQRQVHVILNNNAIFSIRMKDDEDDE